MTEITDEKCVRTPGGFCKLEIELDQDVISGLIDVWANANLHEASLEQYNELMASSGDQTDALHWAIVNDIVIQALTEQIKRTESRLDADATDV